MIQRIKRAQDASECITLGDWEDITKARRLDMLERVVFPSIGNLSVRDISPVHIPDYYKRGGPSVAAEAKRTVSSI